MYKQLNESTNTLEENLQSWNKLSHVLYIDSPSETGFSPKNDGVFNNHKVVLNKRSGILDKSFVCFSNPNCSRTLTIRNLKYFY